ncbi:hypothetical protein Pmani_018419 [Petrolisthes manimaculis]|uniref:Uncharacterized protein n=1 Tax=Petrolisthes manimaculis TaxID=1843537 RepID=A0AAE1U6Q3_9EUCA|nr:hypothetical protein Pmani_018419 [Petrolisthes manimaculis]
MGGRRGKGGRRRHLTPPALLSCFTSSQVAVPNPSVARWTGSTRQAEGDRGQVRVKKMKVRTRQMKG